VKYTVITTFNSQGYKQYGQRMIQTFLANWPADVTLVVYAEGCTVTETAPNLIVQDLDQVPELAAFKRQWSGVPKANGDVSQDPVRSRRKDAGKGFKWDAVRFAHKVYSVFDAARNANSDYLIWMDADMVCHNPITVEQLDRLCDRDLCYLGRRGKYSECGLYAMNLHSENIHKFLRKFQDYYDSAETGIFTLDEWHDSFVFDAVRNIVPVDSRDWSGHLITGEGHPLINSEWGTYLDHLKGSRKTQGRSHAKDLIKQRLESYWQ
jgi:hypothetical protein